MSGKGRRRSILYRAEIGSNGCGKATFDQARMDGKVAPIAVIERRAGV
jgi:hypothetical protein